MRSATAIVAVVLAGLVPAGADAEAGSQERDFTWSNYRYVLVSSGYFGPLPPIRVTVRRREVVRAVYLERSKAHGIDQGDPAKGRDARVTIAALIDRARSRRVAVGRIWWRVEDAAPRRIYIDYDEMILDEERMFFIGPPVRIRARR